MHPYFSEYPIFLRKTILHSILQYILAVKYPYTPSAETLGNIHLVFLFLIFKFKHKTSPLSLFLPYYICHLTEGRILSRPF